MQVLTRQDWKVAFDNMTASMSEEEKNALFCSPDDPAASPPKDPDHRIRELERQNRNLFFTLCGTVLATAAMLFARRR